MLNKVIKAPDSAQPINYLEDEISSAFFITREYEAYYRSLKHVEERRAFYNDLLPALHRLLLLANRDSIIQLDNLITRTVQVAKQEKQSSPFESAVQRVHRMEPIGMQLLGNDAGLDLKRLRSAYRMVALRYHPDHGGSHEQMIAINRAYEQLHRILIEESNFTATLTSDKLSNVFAYLWEIKLLLFEVALDEWTLDEAVFYLNALASDKERCEESGDLQLIKSYRVRL